MKARIPALLVHQNPETLTSLKAAIERQGMRVVAAESCAQAARLLGGLNPPPLIFTEIDVSGGTWADVLAAAEKALQPVNVIVVSRIVDTRFYVEAIESGAFDFIAPPFVAADLDYVVHSALSNVMDRRAAKSPARRPVDALFAGAVKRAHTAAQV